MTSIIKSFSILVASGNGSRCNQLKNCLQDCLLIMDEDLDGYKINILKSDLDDKHRIAEEVYLNISPLFADIDDYYSSIDR